MIEGVGLLLRLLLGLGVLLISGYALARSLAPASRRLEQAALALGLGSLSLTLWLLALAALCLPWRLTLILPLPLALMAASWVGRRFFSGTCMVEGYPPWINAPKPSGSIPLKGWDWVFLGVIGLILLFATLRALLYPIWAWDAVSTWGFKAKVFFLRGTLDLQGFEAHNYYPNLVPLLLTYLYICLGQVNDQVVKIVFPLAGLSLILLVFALLRRLGLSRRGALGITAFFTAGGVTLVEHLHIAYADLFLTYYTLGAGGLVYLWLKEVSLSGNLSLAAFFLAGLSWTKFEGTPLAGTVLLAAALSLLWLHPPGLTRRLWSLSVPGLGLLLGYLPWRLFIWSHGIEMGTDHILGFYPHQFFQAVPALLEALVNPRNFGFLWPFAALALVVCRKKWVTTPLLYLPLFLGGNFLAILLAYAVAPTAPFEFPLYVRATLDRLLLHLAPVAVLLLGEGVKELERGPEGLSGPVSLPSQDSGSFRE
jgi:hypothetical protein